MHYTEIWRSTVTDTVNTAQTLLFNESSMITVYGDYFQVIIVAENIGEINMIMDYVCN